MLQIHDASQFPCNAALFCDSLLDAKETEDKSEYVTCPKLFTQIKMRILKVLLERRVFSAITTSCSNAKAYSLQCRLPHLPPAITILPLFEVWLGSQVLPPEAKSAFCNLSKTHWLDVTVTLEST